MEGKRKAANDGGGGSGEGGHGILVVQMPLRGRTRSYPPPFLMKTFDMVEDPETNCIISWSATNTSFVIWDQIRFTTELLHKYFRHNNFSSFVYQLNNYVSNFPPLICYFLHRTSPILNDRLYCIYICKIFS